jgi:hypothetical protein
MHESKKVFSTSKMPPSIWAAFRDSAGDSFVEDGHMEHEVGGYVREAKGQPDWDQDDVARNELLDGYLVANGAADGEEVLIRHG